MNRIRIELNIVLLSAFLLFLTPAVLLAGGGGDGSIGCSATITCKAFCSTSGGYLIEDYGTVGSRDVDGTKYDGRCVADTGHNGLDLCVQSYAEQYKRKCRDTYSHAYYLTLCNEWKGRSGTIHTQYRSDIRLDE